MFLGCGVSVQGLGYKASDLETRAQNPETFTIHEHALKFEPCRNRGSNMENGTPDFGKPCKLTPA